MLIRFFITSIVGLSGAFASANTSALGKQIEILKDASGRPQLEVRAFKDSYLKGKVWSVKFSITGTDLSSGSPLRIISWRLWDKQAQTFLTDGQTFFESAQDNKLEGNQSLALGVGIASQAQEAIVMGKRLALVFFVGIRDAKGLPTHFIDLGALCESSPQLFSDEVTGIKGCGRYDKPPMSLLMPLGKINIALNDSFFDDYCKTVKSFSQDAAKISTTLPVGVNGGIQRELKLSRVLCDQNDRFVGLKDLKDVNTKVISNMTIATQALANIRSLAYEISPSAVNAINMTLQSFTRKTQIVFEHQLYDAYPDLMSLREIHSGVENQARNLANFYRNQ